MRRWRFLAGSATVIALISISTWLCAAERRGTLPPGNYVAAASTPEWPLTAARAETLRRDALRRAAVRLALPQAPSFGSGAATVQAALLDDPPIPCLFVNDEPTGTSAKFNCVLEGGDVVKVKYSRNPEIHAEVAATRLLSALGFAADEVRIVPRLRCYGCPRYPFFTMQLLWLTSSTRLLSPHGYKDAYTDFEWVAVERKFPAPLIETDQHRGWAWFELAESEAPRADVDALRLLAVFLAHWDNKSENQRLVCLDRVPAAPDQPCSRPLAMVQDLGSTFGPIKVNLARWRDVPVWADRRGCIVTMHRLPFQGATFPDVRISEEGRAQLARQLAALDEDEVRMLFAQARFPEFQSATDDERDVRAWAAAFRHRVDQIVMAGPCQ